MIKLQKHYLYLQTAVLFVSTCLFYLPSLQNITSQSNESFVSEPPGCSGGSDRSVQRPIKCQRSVNPGGCPLDASPMWRSSTHCSLAVASPDDLEDVKETVRAVSLEAEEQMSSAGTQSVFSVCPAPLAPST